MRARTRIRPDPEPIGGRRGHSQVHTILLVRHVSTWTPTGNDTLAAPLHLLRINTDDGGGGGGLLPLTPQNRELSPPTPLPFLSKSEPIPSPCRDWLGMEISRKRRAPGSGFREIRQRELGSSEPTAFTRRAGCSEAFLKRLSLYGKLNGHRGCVNTVHFNPSGEILVSGSDDKQVIFWNWATKNKILSYHSGHQDNVFQARIMPFTEDRCVITSAADGQVRLGQVADNAPVNTKRLGTHLGRVHKLAIEPGSPHIFYSCGEDGVVQHFDLRSQSATQLFSCTSFAENKPTMRLNVIVIDPRNPNYFSVGGFDEYARVYDMRRCQSDASSNLDQPVNTFCPSHLIGSEEAHITGLTYSHTSELLISYNDELVYLFQKDMGIGSDPRSVSAETLQACNQPQVYSGHRNSQTVKGVSFFGPNDDFVVSGSDCGHAYIWRKTGAELLCLLDGDKHIVNCIEPHPHFPFLATSGLEKNVKLWLPTAKKPAPLPDNIQQIMESNRTGREDRARIILAPDVIMHVLRLQRRQALAYIERRQSGSDHDSEEDDEGEALVLGFGDGDAGPEDGSPRECTIS